MIANFPVLSPSHYEIGSAAKRRPFIQLLICLAASQCDTPSPNWKGELQLLHAAASALPS